ncbi:DUF3616 domain-containing protein [Sorangium sp. So ce1000]|uniref:DUF3616 domain-containing protein n=1 Tax=Sorangium sp. So ce1000 TaxID=3133325 RepID=UPI003F625537
MTEHRFRKIGAAGAILGVTGAAIAAASCAAAGVDPLEAVATESFALGAYSASFQDGVSPASSYAGTRDTMLEENAPTTTNGGDTSISVSGDTPGGSGKDDAVLVQWDLSGTIPVDAIVTSATITVTVSDKAAQTYPIYQVLRAWNEGQATWNLAATGSAWATAGAKGASDRGSAELGSINAPSTGSTTITLNAQGLAVVQGWVNDPASNHGVIFASASNDNRLELRSSEYSTKSSRPKLTVSWDLPGGGADGGAPDSGGDAGTGLVQTPGTYRGTCDGSAAVSIDGTHFLNFNDENQQIQVYTQGAIGTSVQQLDVSGAIGLSSSDEADIEGAARVGNRVYVITSHARDKNGVLETPRYKFFAIDLAGAVPSLSMSVAGVYSNLLSDMLDASNWASPNASVISLLNSRSQLSTGTVASLAPKDQGTNIEGLAALPVGGSAGRLVIGFRNPRSSAQAILVTLLNPDAVIGGAEAQFGEAVLLDLGGNGVRDLAWSAAHNAVLMLSGPHDETNGPFALWKWSGVPGSAPVKVQDLTAPAAAAPESVIPYGGTNDVQVLFDMGSFQIGGDDCKDVSASSQYFTDVVVHVD